MRVLESIMFTITFLAFNIWFIGQLGTMGLGIIAQLMIAWFVTGVSLCACYIYREERKREKRDKQTSS